MYKYIQLNIWTIFPPLLTQDFRHHDLKNPCIAYKYSKFQLFTGNRGSAIYKQIISIPCNIFTFIIAIPLYPAYGNHPCCIVLLCLGF